MSQTPERRGLLLALSARPLSHRDCQLADVRRTHTSAIQLPSPASHMADNRKSAKVDQGLSQSLCSTTCGRFSHTVSIDSRSKADSEPVYAPAHNLV